MKRFATILSTLVLGLFLGSTAFAGIDYIKYREDFVNQGNIQKAPPGEKRFEHKSKYEREEPKGTEAPTKERDLNKPANKYDRRYWDPSK